MYLQVCIVLRCIRATPIYENRMVVTSQYARSHIVISPKTGCSLVKFDICSSFDKGSGVWDRSLDPKFD